MSTSWESGRRLVALDAVRTAAILGMMAVHIGGSNLTEPTGPWRLLHLASGFAAGTFAVAAGVALSLTTASAGRAPAGTPSDWTPLALRGLILFALGLLIEPASGRVLVILCVYGVLFLLAPTLRGLSGSGLLVLGGVLLVVWPVVSLAIRRGLDAPQWLEVGGPVLRRPDAGQVVGRILFLDGAYPVPTWLALALVAWGAHRLGLLDPVRRGRMAVISGSLVVAGFGGAALIEALAQPRQHVVADLVAGGLTPAEAAVGADHALGVPASEIWPSLLTAGHHTGTTLELVQILAVAASGYTLATYLLVVAAPLVHVLSWPGRISLSLYVLHLAALGASNWFWLAGDDTAMPAFWALMAFWAGSFLLGAGLRTTRGPFEEVVRTLSRAPLALRR